MARPPGPKRNLGFGANDDQAPATSAAVPGESSSGRPARASPRSRYRPCLGEDGFLAGQSVAADAVSRFINPLAPKKPAIAAKARSVIFLYMYGGPSHIDTFDYKPKMKGLEGKTVAVKTFGRGGHKDQGRIVEPRWTFRPYGRCGKRVSDLFPHVGSCVDDIAFLHSMTADSGTHGSAMLQMNTGTIRSGSPSLGSWVNYGLGSENENLPGFVVMLDPRGGPISGPKNWSSGYMPAQYEGTTIRATGSPILDLNRPKDLSEGAQRALLDTLREYNDEHKARCGNNPALAARIASYELAFKHAECGPRGSRSPRKRQDPGAVRPERQANRGLRPAVPAGATAGGARRALHSDLLRRQPGHHNQLGRSRRSGRRTTSALAARSTGRSPACSRT